MYNLNVCNNLFNLDRYRAACNRGQHFSEQVFMGIVAFPFIAMIHELGHAVAAWMLFENACPKIELKNYGYNGGVCRYHAEVFSKIGRQLGESNSRAIVAAAGPVSQIITALALSYFFPGNGVSWLGLTANCFYAVSTFFEKAFFTGKMEDYKTHDFVRISLFKGRAACAALMIASIAFFILGTAEMMVSIFAAGQTLSQYR